MVSTSVSRVMGKRLCQQVPRYEIDGKYYCAKHHVVGQLEECRAALADEREARERAEAALAEAQKALVAVCCGLISKSYVAENPHAAQLLKEHASAIDAAIERGRGGK